MSFFLIKPMIILNWVSLFLVLALAITSFGVGGRSTIEYCVTTSQAHHQSIKTRIAQSEREYIMLSNLSREQNSANVFSLL